ncbi:family 43 glycosylhydrolase [Aeoliella mucimassa]|uniref:non-reducing end alpha-L-arabinofuranosidase n=1 Tax=Aeoliella mucimassa TaxID=2527972 RepID=A0A518AKA7_9BACT|nr:family 43 glycosylhydrolase [Aeoliella mucimassa]QDU55114.1 Extracellular exo-alpha-L-arabinofuranosidase precursor [Aeoliella mucimassa]
MNRLHSIAIVRLFFCLTALLMVDASQADWLFTSFRGSGDGLHLAYSNDARNWTEIRGNRLKPEVGSKLMRDPHIVRGPDNTFHMVWTSGWGDKGIGYASSQDLVNWSEQKFLPLMEHESDCRTCWAPEAIYDARNRQFIVMWSSDIPSASPEENPKGGYHRAYYVTTRDFETFSKPKMLFDPGFNNIDTTMLKVGNKYRIVFKETDDQPAGIWGRICGAEADSPTGPFKLLEKPIIANERVEGPAVVEVDGSTLLYVDYYANGRYGCRESSDWQNWRDVTRDCTIIDGQRHGSIIEVSHEELAKIDPSAGAEPPQAVLTGVNADPHIAFFGDRCYLYPTTDGTEGWRSTSFQCWSSDDLVNWKNEGVILDLPRDLEWADLHAWAPACATKNGKYYYYYSADKNIGVAVADRPEGPFRDPLGKPLVSSSDYSRMQAIDPMVFVDDDGQAYLFWGQGRCKAVPLNDDMISFDPKEVRDITPPGYNEGPFVHKRKGLYYLTWSEFDTRDPRYSVAYATSSSPLGPYTKAKQNPILKQKGIVKGAGHHSLANIPGTDDWVIAYHRFRIPGGDGYHRETCLSPLRFNDDGSIEPVDVYEAVKPTKWSAAESAAPATKVEIDLSQPGKEISADLFGIFFEDLNYAADGGLYAELVENRSFEYSVSDNGSWNALTNWRLLERDGGKGHVVAESNQPLHANNPHYAVLGVIRNEGLVGIENRGFQGLPIEKGKPYDFSLFARQIAGSDGDLLVRLEAEDGAVLAEANLGKPTSSWKQLQATLTAEGSTDKARLIVASRGIGRVALDMVSLFPQDTFKGRKNGLRKDLAQTIADLKPKFVRFPGGCLVHGDGLDNMYRWQDTIGPVHERKSQRNIWTYHQTFGLGYFEYFQFCEDIGAKPVPVVPAGVCCQNAGARITRKWGEGQRGIPLDDMPEYIQEVLNLIEYANGPADSPWGSKRAAAGHPEPFGLEYLGIGNEDAITPEFEERFRMIHRAVEAAHPEITVIGTVGPFSDGEDFDKGWLIANDMHLAMVDEHYYRTPEWFLENLSRYDSYDREKSAVYLGEYAAHERDRRTTLRSALAEAAYMTHLERNGDIVRLSSYAPLLGKVGRTQWNPDLIYFDNQSVSPTINYYVQQMFSAGSGDTYLATECEQPMSVVRDHATGDVVIKLVNLESTARKFEFELSGAAGLASSASCTTLTGPLMHDNKLGDTGRVEPVNSTISVGPEFEYTAPGNSLTVIRLTPSGK